MTHLGEYEETNSSFNFNEKKKVFVALDPVDPVLFFVSIQMHE